MDSAGSGSSTAYPWATAIHGFQRHDHAFHDASGPPWIHSSSGAGRAPDVPEGRASHARTREPSSAVVSISVRVPGSTGVSCGPRNGVDSWSGVVASRRTGRAGSAYDVRIA